MYLKGRGKKKGKNSTQWSRAFIRGLPLFHESIYSQYSKVTLSRLSVHHLLAKVTTNIYCLKINLIFPFNKKNQLAIQMLFLFNSIVFLLSALFC